MSPRIVSCSLISTFLFHSSLRAVGVCNEFVKCWSEGCEAFDTKQRVIAWPSVVTVVFEQSVPSWSGLGERIDTCGGFLHPKPLCSL